MSNRHYKITTSTDDDFTGNEMHTTMDGKKRLKNRPKPKQSAKTKKAIRAKKIEKKLHKDDNSFHVRDLVKK